MDQFCHRLLTGIQAGALLAFLGSCSGFFPSPLVVTGYSPASSVDLVPGEISIWVEFNREVPRAQAEKGITLEESGKPQSGRFSWSGARVAFVPDRGFSLGKRYDLTVAGTVEDSRGVELGQDFHICFRTGTGGGRPEVIIADPPRGSTSADLFQPVTVTFSRAVDRVSFVSNFRTDPPVKAAFLWEPGDLSCKVVPLESLLPQTMYSVWVGGAVESGPGILSGTEAKSWFRTGTPGPGPVLTLVRPLTREPLSGEWFPEPDPNPGFEGFSGIELTFDRPVVRETLETCLSIEPRWIFTVPKGERSCSRFLLVPSERLIYGKGYRLTVKKGIADGAGTGAAADQVFCFQVSGPRSAPPHPVLLVFRPRTGVPTSIPGNHSADFQALDLGAYTVEPGEAELEFVFKVAEGAELDRESLWKKFSVSATDPRTVVDIRSLRTDSRSADGTQVARAVLQVKRGGAGILVFHLAAGTSDTAGNTLDQDFDWPVLG